MPVVPPQGKKEKVQVGVKPSILQKFKNFLLKVRKNYIKHFFRYSVFAVLLMEVLSLLMSGLKNYSTYWYPLLTQITLFALCFPMFSMANRLRLCLRKKLAFGLLSLSYFLGIIYLILGGFSDALYFKITQYLLLIGVFLCVALSIRKAC